MDSTSPCSFFVFSFIFALLSRCILEQPDAYFQGEIGVFINHQDRAEVTQECPTWIRAAWFGQLEKSYTFSAAFYGFSPNSFGLVAERAGGDIS